jgi:ribose transport system ATP-binding protein
VPEDRKLAGLILQMNIAQNISLANITKIEHWGFLNESLENSMAKKYLSELNIKAASPHQIVEELSGGNQQKVVLAKWLATQPNILLLDEPTRGIDVKAKNEIYKLIGNLASSGIAIVMISSELPEILSISDRIIVLSEGKISGEFSPTAATEEKLLEAAIPKSLV